jgi:16S rRNA C1402 (ribose-2'-O) methylase RsmI
MDDVFDSNRHISIAKELTKTFETIITGNTTKILHYLTECKEHQNGEFVVLVSGNKNAGEQEQLLQLRNFSYKNIHNLVRVFVVLMLWELKIV